MSELSWRKVKTVTVPNPARAGWTPAADYVTPKRFYRIKVTANDGWGPHDHAVCSADGHPRNVGRDTPLLIPDSPLGCLVAKVGGSTADNKGELLTIGRRCVFQVDDTKAGPLYLGMNDTPIEMTNLRGTLTVEIETAL
jgi:hypothetical protein